MKIMLDEGKGIMPSRAHENDAGLDLYTPVDVTVRGSTAASWAANLAPVDIGCATIDTGVHVEIPKGYVGYIKSKSGLMCRSGLTADGTIDSGYTGSICVKLFNHTAKDYTFKAGEKVAQLVIHPIITPELELVDELEDTERGTGGFGSTGR